jgi:hypothetical protein
LHRRLDPRDDDAIGADIQYALEQARVQFRHAHQRHRITAHRSPNVFEDLLPIEVPVFGVDDDPVQAQRHRHFRNAGRLQGHPQTVDGFLARQLSAKPLQGGDFHVMGL